MNLSLPPEIQRQIDERVRAGKYRSPEDVVTAAIAGLGPQEHLRELGAPEMETLFPGIREQLAEGLAAARAGRLGDGDAFFAELERQEKASSSPNRKTA